MKQFRVLVYHCRRMFMVAGALMVCAYLFAPYAMGGRFWTGSAWMMLSPLILLARYPRSGFVERTQAVLMSPRRSSIHLLELCVAAVLSVMLGCVCVGDVTLSALILGLWGSFLCGLASVFEQMKRPPSTAIALVFGIGTLLWTSPFWLGPWLGEPGFTPWLASWLMWLHPVSLALSLSDLTNLIEPIFYSVTFVGVVEVELFDPLAGLFIVGIVTLTIFVTSYVVNRRRSGSLGYVRSKCYGE